MAPHLAQALCMAPCWAGGQHHSKGQYFEGALAAPVYRFALREMGTEDGKTEVGNGGAVAGNARQDRALRGPPGAQRKGRAPRPCPRLCFTLKSL